MNMRINTKKIENRLNFLCNNLRKEKVVRILSNSGWLVTDKVFVLIIGVFVSAAIARYFGAEAFGSFNYALSFVTLFSSFSTLGLEILTIKSLLGDEHEEGTILFTSFVLRVLGGIFISIISFPLIVLIEPFDSSLHLMVLLLSTVFIFRSFEVIEYWVQAYHKAKISSIIRIFSYLVISVLRIVLILFKGTVVHYTILYIIESIIIGFLLFFAYVKNRRVRTAFVFNVEYARYTLSHSVFIIMSGIAGTLYMQIDKIMLGKMLITKSELGIYSVATQISQLWYFVPLAIITSLRPEILKQKKSDEKKYYQLLQIQYTTVAWIGLIFGLFIFFTSKSIVGFLYGDEYIRAAEVLQISVWAGTFALLGSARGTWLISENLQRYSFVYVGLGAILNIVLNYILIPFFGGSGAAFATLLSQISVAIVFPLFISKTRESSIMMLKSFIFKGII